MSLSTVSANSLFHFTNKLEYLEDILKNNFSPRYCMEDHRMVMPINAPFIEYFQRAIPMICFCDIPLSQIRNHISAYGRYAIGLSKEWGISKGITPVLYAHPKSITTDYFQKMATALREGQFIQNDNSLDPISVLGNMIRFIKPYSDEVIRNGEKITVRYYDEREWRFVPANSVFTEAGIPSSLLKEDFSNLSKRTIFNTRLSEFCKLEFEPRDVTYIILQDDNEIKEMLLRIGRIKERYNFDDIELLKTRLISIERVLGDF